MCHLNDGDRHRQVTRERDAAWAELNEIRARVLANPEEATSDEVSRRLAQCMNGLDMALKWAIELSVSMTVPGSVRDRARNLVGRLSGIVLPISEREPIQPILEERREIEFSPRGSLLGLVEGRHFYLYQLTSRWDISSASLLHDYKCPDEDQAMARLSGLKHGHYDEVQS